MRHFTAALIVLLSLASAKADASVSSGSTAAKSMDSFYCDFIMVPVDAHGYPVVRSATLSGSSLTLTVSYGTAQKLKGAGIVSIANNWPLGLKVDDQPTIGLHPLIEEPTLRLSLFLRGLSPGKHRVDVGLMEPSGKLQEDNSYCFSVPGNERWSY